MLKCKRVCFYCLSYLEDYFPRSTQSAIRNFGLDRKTLKTLPCLKGIPGVYSYLACPQRRRLTLYDSSAARSAALTLYGSEEAMRQHALVAENCQKAEYQQKLDHFFSEDATRRNGGVDMRRKPQRPFEDISLRYEGNPLRWMGIVKVPSIRPISKELEWGFCCAGCQDYDDEHLKHWSNRYTPSTFRDHIKRLGPLKNIASDTHPKLSHAYLCSTSSKSCISISWAAS